ncbi:MAG: glycine hydroxymethyltransferase [Clostridiales bacterium]|jgi:glycine hydroxymethyltransferase|nr:glycine hydroxymethyltransferase [Clostridiales bacterium]
MDILKDYLTKTAGEELNAEMLTFVANIDAVAKKRPEIAKSIVKELVDQRSHLKLIASENFCSLAVQSAMGNLLTDKYAEGYAGNRFYAGCDNVDDIERLASKEAMALLGAEHAYVQPHSGADANLVAFWAILRKHVQTPALEKFGEKNLLNITKEQWDEIRAEMGNQKLLGMDLYSGGHLTHGYRHNVSAQMFDVYNYHVDKETGLLDYENLRQMLHDIKPLIFLIGFSAYTGAVDYELLKSYADEVGAVMMVDMAHFAGLVAGGGLTGKYNPIPYAHICTTTTHKTLRGPRGGMVLCKKEYAEYVDKGCPHVMGGPLPNVMAAKAIAFKEANTPEFKAYAKKIIENSKQLAASLIEKGIKVQAGGTENHIVLVDVAALGLTGRQAESALRECGMTLNRNTLPFDEYGPWYTSGLRLGTPATTTLGMGRDEMAEIADIIAAVLKSIKPALDKKGNVSKARYTLDEDVKTASIRRIKGILDKFVLYPEIDTDFFTKYFN